MYACVYMYACEIEVQGGISGGAAGVVHLESCACMYVCVCVCVCVCARACIVPELKRVWSVLQASPTRQG